MSEFATGNEPEYFRDNTAVLSAIHDKMRVLVMGQPAASITYDFATGSVLQAELPTALDFIGCESVPDFDRAEDEARKSTNQRQETARWDGMILVSDCKAQCFSVARDKYAGRWESPEAKEAFHALNMRDPMSVSWRQLRGYDPYGHSLRVTSTVLVDKNGQQYADRVRLVVDDGQVRTTTSLVRLDGEFIGCRREITPLKNEIIERIEKTVDREDVCQLVVAIAVGAVMDVSVDLESVASKYENRPEREEVATLLHDVRRYSQTIRSAIDFRVAVGDTGRPSSEDLAELNVYLASL